MRLMWAETFECVRSDIFASVSRALKRDSHRPNFGAGGLLALGAIRRAESGRVGRVMRSFGAR